MAEDGPPIELAHRGCGGTPTVELTCDRCGQEVGARDAEVKPGPGLAAA